MAVVVSALGDIVNSYRDNNNLPLVGGMLLTQAGGVNYPTYVDPAGTTQNTNPIILNNRGEIATSSGTSVPLYVQQNIAYTFTLFDSLGNQIWSTPAITAPATIAGILALPPSTLGQVIYPQTPAEVAANVTPVNYQYVPHEARREGAVGNALTDDSTAISNATKVAQEGYYDIPLQSWLVGGGFNIANTVTTSYAGQGQVNFKGAKVHGPAVIYPTTSTNVFEIDADAYGQQEAKFKLADMMVAGDGTHTPTFMYTSNIAFSEVESINSFNGGPIVNWHLGGEHRARNCTHFGGTVGFTMTSSHDTYVTECHAYGGTIGMQALGVNSANTDGNNNFINTTSHGHSVYSYDIEGLYSPVISNFTTETTPTQIYVKNCTYGRITGGFMGPSNGTPAYSIHFDGTNNYGYNVSQVNIQNEMQITNLQTSVISDIISSTTPTSITGAAISMTGALNILNGCMIRNPLLAYSYIQDVNSSANIINGGRYEQQIYLQGTKSQRSYNVICPNYLAGGIKTDDTVQGQFALTEYVRFWDGTRINETGVGYLLPYLAQTGTLAASGGTATFDTATIVAMPVGGSANSTEAEFMVSGGASGSISASKVLVIRGFEITTATILGGNGARGSFTVSVSGSVITVTNPSATANVPYTVRMIKHATY